MVPDGCPRLKFELGEVENEPLAKSTHFDMLVTVFFRNLLCQCLT
jgi:hypothetical protein